VRRRLEDGDVLLIRQDQSQKQRRRRIRLPLANCIVAGCRYANYETRLPPIGILNAVVAVWGNGVIANYRRVKKTKCRFSLRELRMTVNPERRNSGTLNRKPQRPLNNKP
jgi:hypothetical protein